MLEKSRQPIAADWQRFVERLNERTKGHLEPLTERIWLCLR